ncbi:MAG: tetratricopeptide repeat protein [Actinomycetota bacterium]|nr:tetratricopeptide repeat protein [Actinomycetota bacterium]
MPGTHLLVDRMLVALAVVLTGVLFVPDATDPVNVVKLSALLASTAAALAAAAVRVTRERVLRLPLGLPAYAVLALLLALVVATVVAPHTPTAVYGTFGRNSGLLAYTSAIVLFLLSLRLFDRRGTVVVALGFVVAGGVTAAYGLLQLAGADPVQWNNPFNPIIASLGNPNFASAYVAICTPPAVWGALSDGWGRAWRAACGTVAVLCLAAALLSDAIQGPLAAAGGLIVLATAWLLERGGALRRAGLSVVGVLAGLGLVGLVAGMFGTGPARAAFSGISYRARVWYWESAINMFERSPVWGVGLDSYGIRFRQERPIEVARELGGDHFSDAAHSVPLQMLAQGGLLLGLAYLTYTLVVAWCLLRGLRTCAGHDRLLLGGLGGAWVAYQVQSLVSIDQVPLLVAQFVLAAAVVVLAGAARLREVRLPGAVPLPSAEPSPRRGRRAPLPRRRTPDGLDQAVTAGAVLAALVLTWLAFSPLRASQAAFDGDVLAVSGAGDAARERYEAAIDLAPTVSVYRTKLGALYNQAGRPAEALAAFREAAEADPFDVGAVRTAGRLADAVGQFDVAEQYLERAVSLEPRNSAAVVDLARFLLQHDAAKRARDLLEPVVVDLPGDAGLWATLGDARLMADDPRAARAAYDNALRLVPGEPTATAGLKQLGL